MRPISVTKTSPWLLALQRAGLAVAEEATADSLSAELAALEPEGEAPASVGEVPAPPGGVSAPAGATPAPILAQRQDLRFRVPVELSIPGLGASSVLPLQTLGPFPGLTGQHWFDLFGPVEAYTVYTSGGSIPTLVLTQARLPRPVLKLHPGGSYTVEISGGTVWILASALDPALPGGRYLGFTVSSGSLALAGVPTITGQRLTLPGGLEGTLEVIPAAPGEEGAAGGNAGQCQADVSIVPPSKLAVTWSKAQPPTIKLGTGSATFAGETVKFTKFDSTITAQPALEAVLFGYALTPKKLDVGPLSSAVVTLEGETPISGGWALTLTQPLEPDRPGEALGPGFYLLLAQEPITARWPGASGPVQLDQATLTLRAGQLSLGSRQATATPRMEQTLELYALRSNASPPAPAPRLPLGLSFGPADFVFAYVCDAEQGEGLYAECTANLQIDRPIDLAGRPLAFGEATPALFSLERQGAATSVQAIGLAAALQSPGGLARRLLALRNALLAVTEPAMFLLRGILSGESAIDAGRLELVLGSEGWLATLPDPYVSNPGRGIQRGSSFAERPTTGIVLAQTVWEEPAHPVLSFSGVLPPPAVAVDPPSEGSPRALAQGEVQVPTQTQQGSTTLGGERPLARLQGAERYSAQPVEERAAELTRQQRQLAELQALAREELPNLGSGLRLLDVSTNKDLLGVELGVGESAKEGPTSFLAYSLGAMDVHTEASNLRVFTLPQVQWEPVRTLDIDQDIPHIGYFPTPLASATDGGATVFGVRSERLVATIPDLAVDAALEEFKEAKVGLAMLTTLPFGIQALLTLQPTVSPSGRSPDSIARNQPDFTPQALQGGAQLALVAESGQSAGPTSSSFEGAALQLLNGVALDSGAPLDISVLGSPKEPVDSVQSFFNKEFGPSGENRRVPVTRLDISGYGESTFSDWMQPVAYAQTAKAQFEVIVGRTALEVIKIASVLYPWGIRLTRSVTIERTAGAGVIRRDSGWQASSPGVFHFPAGTSTVSPYVVEPGLLRGLFNVRNIRPTGGLPVEFTAKSGKQALLTPKYFDADAHIDGLELAEETTPALGLLGFLQVEPEGERLADEDLAALIAQQGPIGGPVDGTVQVGESGFRLRATRIEVGNATDPVSSRPEFVGVVRGAPLFHQDGAWSSIRRPGPGNPKGEGEAVGVGSARGVPVVREGKLLEGGGETVQVGPSGEYRFADPIDLHAPDDPQFEYGFMQVSPAHAFLFPRPHIAPGVAELSTRSVPCVADVYARMTAKGAFPPGANAIQLPANALLIDFASGAFRLRDAVDVTNPRPPLILATNGSDVVQLDYSEARLSSGLGADNWSFDLTELQLWSDLLGIKRFSGWSSDLHAGTSRRPVIENINTLMAPVLQSALGFLRGLSAPPTLASIDLSAVNGASEIQLSVIRSRYWAFPEDPPPPAPPLPGPKLKLTLGVKGQFGWEHTPAGVPTPEMPTAPTLTRSGAALLWGQIEGKFPLGGAFFLLLGAQLQIGAKFLITEDPEVPAGTSPGSVTPPHKPELMFDLEVKAYIGIGMKGVKIEGSLAIGFAFAIEGAQVKRGPLVLLQGELTLPALAIEVSGEFKGLFFDEGSHHMCEWGGQLEVNVVIGFWGIHFGVEIAETTTC